MQTLGRLEVEPPQIGETIPDLDRKPTQEEPYFNHVVIVLVPEISANRVLNRWKHLDIVDALHLHVRLRLVESKTVDLCARLEWPLTRFDDREDGLTASVMDAGGKASDSVPNDPNDAMLVSVVEFTKDGQERHVGFGWLYVRLVMLDSCEYAVVTSQRLTQSPVRPSKSVLGITDGELDGVNVCRLVRPDALIPRGRFDERMVEARAERLDDIAHLKPPTDKRHFLAHPEPEGYAHVGRIVFRDDFVGITLKVLPHLAFEGFHLLACPPELEAGATELGGHPLESLHDDER
jgi:hypothetical protein